MAARGVGNLKMYVLVGNSANYTPFVDARVRRGTSACVLNYNTGQ